VALLSLEACNSRRGVPLPLGAVLFEILYVCRRVFGFLGDAVSLDEQELLGM